MDWIHAHLVVNHFPIVLSVLAAAGFLALGFNMGTALGVVGLVGGALLIAGALRLRGAR